MNVFNHRIRETARYVLAFYLFFVPHSSYVKFSVPLNVLPAEPVCTEKGEFSIALLVLVSTPLL